MTYLIETSKDDIGNPLLLDVIWGEAMVAHHVSQLRAAPHGVAVQGTRAGEGGREEEHEQMQGQKGGGGEEEEVSRVCIGMGFDGTQVQVIQMTVHNNGVAKPESAYLRAPASHSRPSVSSTELNSVRLERGRRV